jgi:hypothetical protein
VSIYDALRERETEADTPSVTPAAAVATEERSEDAWEVLRRNSDPLIAHRDGHPTIVGRELESDRRRLLRVLGRVVEQIVEDTGEETGLGVDRWCRLDPRRERSSRIVATESIKGLVYQATGVDPVSTEDE